MRKPAVMMDMPEGKQPGFYAQVVKGLAGKVALLDRDKELLILEKDEDRGSVLEVLNHYKIAHEDIPLYWLPDNATVSGLFEDYGFVTRSDNRFLYAKLIVVFRFADELPTEAEPDQAVLQMEEHLIARWNRDGLEYFAADQQQAELMEGIARAYKCSLVIGG
ncbi:hypothetical protein N6H14_23125 [Paenibacillus sp. CC-CFT747]|nr:hypothetical protein N6H14_23125 [Paenibacillus sp. CC-CFT747]